jgi:hypothetical protein
MERGQGPAAAPIQETDMEETRKPARKPRAASSTPSGTRPAAPRKTTRQKKTVANRPGDPAPASRDEMVRMAAYFRAERRGFTAGYDLEDWLAAETEVAALLKAPSAAKPRKTPARKATTRSSRGRKTAG